MINKRLKDVLFTDQWSEVCMERLSPFGYVLVSNDFYYKHICTLTWEHAKQLRFRQITQSLMSPLLPVAVSVHLVP